MPFAVAACVRRCSSWSSSSASSWSRPTTTSSRSSSGSTRPGRTSTSALKQRHDELPNLVTAVRDVMAFEQAVLEEVTRLRERLRPRPTGPRAGRRCRPRRAGRCGRCSRSSRTTRSSGRPRTCMDAPGRDRATRGRHRRPARALQRPGLPLQHADRPAPGGPAGRRVRLASGATSSPPTRTRIVRPDVSLRSASRAGDAPTAEG